MLDGEKVNKESLAPLFLPVPRLTRTKGLFMRLADFNTM